MIEEREVGFIQGFVYALGILAADHDRPDIASEIWSAAGYSDMETAICAEYDVAKLRKAVPGLNKGTA